MQQKNRAFTLIELLVVIAIIAILAAILFPVFAQAKQAAKKSVSLSNVKQLSLSNVIYAGDYDDTFPDQTRDVNGFPFWTAGSENPCTNVNGVGDDNDAPVGGCKLGFMSPQAHQNWGQELYPYVKSLDLYQSSAQKLSGGVPWSYSAKPSAGNASYMYNGVVLAKSQTQISDPAALIVFHGKSQTGREANVQPTQFTNSGTMPSGETGPLCNGIDIVGVGSTYDGQDNYGYSDGHAKNSKRTAVTFRNYGISSKVMQADFPGAPTGPFPNTTGMHDPKTSDGGWWASWGVCCVSSL